MERLCLFYLLIYFSKIYRLKGFDTLSHKDSFFDSLLLVHLWLFLSFPLSFDRNLALKGGIKHLAAIIAHKRCGYENDSSPETSYVTQHNEKGVDLAFISRDFLLQSKRNA